MDADVMAIILAAVFILFAACMVYIEHETR